MRFLQANAEEGIPNDHDPADQELAAYVYIFLVGMALVGAFSFVVYCYHQRRLARFVQADNAHNNMQRHSLVDSFLEEGESEWACSVCYHENHPAKVECLMCGTSQIISTHAIATTVKSGTQPPLPPILPSPTALTNLLAARQRSFHVRRLNQRQRGAARRKLWKRTVGSDGQLRWGRTDLASPPKPPTHKLPSHSNASAVALRLKEQQSTSSQPLPLPILSTDPQDAGDSYGVLTELTMMPMPSSEILSPRITRMGARMDPDGHKLETQPSVGYVRQVDSDGNVSWVVADASLRVSNPYAQWNPVEFPRTSTVDFEAVASLPFRQKVRWCLHELDRISVPWEQGHLLLKIRRDAVLTESMHLLMLVPASDIRQRLRIEFIDEPGLDAGGLMREWVLLLCEQLFAPSYGLFVTTHDENLSYWINEGSGELCPDHLRAFEFMGRLMAKCLLEGQLLTVHFALPLLKHLLGVPISFSDLEFLDADVYRSALYIRENGGVEGLALDFTAAATGPNGVSTTKDLIPGGADVTVTDANKLEYLSHLLHYRMFTSVSTQLTALMTGFYDVLPKSLLAVFDYQELELLLCGVPSIDVDDWERHCDVKFMDYDVPTKKEKAVVSHFWQTLRAFSQEERARLLQFVTGTSRVPVEGFKALTSNDGRVRRFGIQLVQRDIPPAGLYPKAHTCFNRLDLPLYTSHAELETYLTLVINMEITGFTMQ